ncbi:hypothetical protein FY004_29650 [Streptomyces parvus]|uniref:Uncharacterized protein n=1 Tax=Streptomyces parvus TaxID=66428 RepID=A0A5D4IHH3_9ACTN|nr:hypothetical protein FY004_29650 [Streptomyces parvus]
MHNKLQLVGTDDLPTGRHEAMQPPGRDGAFRVLLSHDGHSVDTDGRTREPADDTDRPLLPRS